MSAEKSRDLKQILKRKIFFLVLMTLALQTLFLFFYTAQMGLDNSERLLETAIKTLWDQYDMETIHIEAILKENCFNGELKEGMRQRDQALLQRIMERWQLSDNSSSLWCITDAQGNIMENSGSPGLGQHCFILDFLPEQVGWEQAQTFTALVEPEDLEHYYPDLAEKAKISLFGKEEVYSRSLMNFVVMPIYEQQDLLGYTVGGVLLNNNLEILEAYSQKIAGTYVSISTSDGVRISSNVMQMGLQRPTGSFQDKDLVTAILAGKHFSGIVPSVDSLLLAEPIKGADGAVIGSVCVGALLSNVFPYKSWFLAFFLILCLVGVAGYFISEEMAKNFVKPIYALIDKVELVADCTLQAQNLAWNNKGPEELNLLAQSVIKMANALKEKEDELQFKVYDRTKALEEAVKAAESVSHYRSQFLSNMTHELKTPLTGIIGFSELMLDETIELPLHKYRLYAEKIYETGYHLLKIVEDILYIGRYDRGKANLNPEWFTLQPFLAELRDLVRKSLSSKQLSLEYDLEEGLGSVYLDRDKLFHILSNLLTNSIKFTPPQGHISLGVHFSQGCLQFEVQDDGIGIAQQDQERIFLAFEQAEDTYSKNYSGSGLGLSISKMLVEQHRGRIWLKSQLGGGTSVYFTLPIQNREGGIINE